MPLPSSEIQQKIQQWKNKLSNKSRSNSLLNFRESSGKNQRLEIESSVLFDSLFKDFSDPLEISFLELDESEKVRRIKRFQYLRRTSVQIKREKGINSLFATIGQLSWKPKDSPSNIISSPIIVVPIELQKVKAKDEYLLTPISEELVINPTLSQRLESEYNIVLSEIADQKLLSWGSFKAQLEEYISEYSEWGIESINYLSLFEQRTSAILRDLEEHEDLIAAHPVLCGLANDFETYKQHNEEYTCHEELDEQEPKENFQILDADSSQQSIINAAKNGLNFITQGPPGTGKSQTIANIVSELICSGKTVLVVAEKPSALKVIYQRFKACNIEKICLPFHHDSVASKKGFGKFLMSEIRSIENSPNFYFKDYFFEQL